MHEISLYFHSYFFFTPIYISKTQLTYIFYSFISFEVTTYPQNILNIQNPAIKTEPRDTSPQPQLFGGSLVQPPNINQSYRVPLASPSPQPVSPGTPTTAYGDYASPPYHTFQNTNTNDAAQPNFDMTRTHNLPILHNYNYNDIQFQNPAGLEGPTNLPPLLPSVGVPNTQYTQYNNLFPASFGYKPNITVAPSNLFNQNNFTPDGTDLEATASQSNQNPNEITNMSTNSFDITNALDMYSVSSTEIRQQIQQIVGATEPMNTASSNEDEENISDCFTRLTTNTINEIANLNQNNS